MREIKPGSLLVIGLPENELNPRVLFVQSAFRFGSGVVQGIFLNLYPRLDRNPVKETIL
jgi:hypothetical protein